MKNGFTTGVAADSGYALNEELTTRLNTAANIITTASNTLGADSTEVQTAQAALDSFSACLGAVQSDGRIHAPDSLSVYTGGRMHMLYQSNETLGTAIGQLYAKLQEQAADPMKMVRCRGSTASSTVRRPSSATCIITMRSRVTRKTSAASRPACWASCSAYRRWNFSHEDDENILPPHCGTASCRDRRITALAPAASAANIQLPSLLKDQCVVDDAGVLSDSTTSELETLTHSSLPAATAHRSAC